MKAAPFIPTAFSTTTGIQKSNASQENLREAARQFESVFAQMMLSSMRSASIGDDLMGDGGLYRDIYDSQMAKSLSAGRGLGIAELMVRQLQTGQPQTEEMQALRMPQRSAPSASRAQAFASADAFVEAIQPYAEAAAQRLGVPVKYVMAQAALESGWGKQPADKGHNLFGIKADRSWQGPASISQTHEFVDGEHQKQSAAFRRYDSVGESFSDYVDFLTRNPRYEGALNHGGDGEKFVRGLQAAGYATDPEYAEKIIKLAESGPIQSGKHRSET